MLRGTSASVRMQPHDIAFFLAGLLDGTPDAAAMPEHMHDAHTDCGGPDGSWTPPPMIRT